MESFHDYYIHGYKVNSLERSIEFNLAWPEKDGSFKITNLIFEGVFGYEFKNDSMISIVLEFEEVSLQYFISKYKDQIAEAYKQSGAYGNWANDLSKAEIELTNNNVKAIMLWPSMGMEGWILAQHVTTKMA